MDFTTDTRVITTVTFLSSKTLEIVSITSDQYNEDEIRGLGLLVAELANRCADHRGRAIHLVSDFLECSMEDARDFVDHAFKVHYRDMSDGIPF